MAKILLLNPPSSLIIYKEDRCQNEVDELVQNVIRPPIALMELAGISEELNHETKIIDAPVEKISKKLLEIFIAAWKPDWVVANISLQTMESELDSLKFAKARGAKTIIFGYAPSIKDIEIMKGVDYIDFTIRKEPEMTFQELLRGDSSLNEIKGLTFRENNEIKQNPDRDFIENLDDLPFPAHDKIRNDLYRVPTSGEMFTTIQTSKGCPHRCTFCLSNLLNGYKVRKRSITSLVKEIKLVTNKLHIHNFFFRADTFTFDKQWVLQLCQAIVKNKLKIQWFCNSRVDTIDRDMLFAMKRAGCRLITFGVESGDKRILKYIKKGITKEQIIKGIHLTRDIGILTGTIYIIGLPGDSLKSIHETVQFSKKVDSDLVEFVPFIPFIGTESINQATPQLDPSLLRKLSRYAFIQFYLRPKIILRLIRNFILDVQGIKQFFNLLAISIKTGARILKK